MSNWEHIIKQAQDVMQNNRRFMRTRSAIHNTVDSSKDNYQPPDFAKTVGPDAVKTRPGQPMLDRSFALRELVDPFPVNTKNLYPAVIGRTVDKDTRDLTVKLDPRNSNHKSHRA